MTRFPASRISFRRMGMAAAALAALLASAPALSAQAQPAFVRLRGQVVDVESGQPLSEAYVGFPALGRSVLTDREGHFTVMVPPGEHQMVFMRLGYRSAMLPLAMGTEEKEVRLRATPDPVVLEGLEARVDAFEERRSRSALDSRAFNAEALEAFGHSNPIEFLSQRGGMWLRPCTSAGYLGPNDLCATVRGEPSAPTVILDETLLSGGLGDLRMIPLRDLHRIEVYRGGELVVAYTRSFMAQALRTRRTLHSISAFRNWARTQGNSITPGTAGSMENL
jgi:hypothetical protein